MTKTKAQLRAEAVERLRWFESSDEGDGYYWDVTRALLGKRPTEYDDSDELVSALVDLLTDECGPCYSCAKLAELVAENSQLRVKVDKQAEVLDLQQELLDERDVEATTKSSEKDGNDGETSDVDSRDNGWYLRYDGYMTSKSNYLRISGFKAARALDNRQNLVFVKFMGGKEADCRVYAPKLDVCENLHDSSKETQKPRSREADSGNVSDSDGENLHVEQDSREKLEADANGYVMSWWQSDWVDSFAHANSMKRDIMRLLDRHAAITEREIFDEMPHVRDKLADLCEDVAERDDVIAVLKSENADLQAKLDELAERKCPGYEPESHHCCYHHQDFELNHQTVSRLKRENAELKAKVDSLSRGDEGMA